MIDVQEMGTDGAVVTPEISRWDAANSLKLRDKIFPLVDDSVSRVVLDLSYVDFIDSSGLGVMVGLMKKIGKKGDLIICNLQPSVASSFKLSRMDRVFRICADLNTAKAELEKVA